MAKQKAKKGLERSSEASVTSGPACATRARTKVAAEAATEKKTVNKTAGGTRSRRKQRTDKGSIEEKRRKRTKTCEKKLNELGELTDTLALFGYYDPKTNEWHGSIHTPDGQQIPADIYDKLMDIRARGPRVRRRGRAPKQTVNNKAGKTTHGSKPDRDVVRTGEPPSATQPEASTIINSQDVMDADGSGFCDVPLLDFEFSSDGLNFQSPTQHIAGENAFVPTASVDFGADLPQYPAVGQTDKWPFSEFLDDSMALPMGAWMPQVSIPEHLSLPGCDGMLDSTLRPEQTCQADPSPRHFPMSSANAVNGPTPQSQKKLATAPPVRELDSRTVADLWNVLSAIKVKIEEDEKFWQKSIPAKAASAGS